MISARPLAYLSAAALVIFAIAYTFSPSKSAPSAAAAPTAESTDAPVRLAPRSKPAPRPAAEPFERSFDLDKVELAAASLPDSAELTTLSTALNELQSAAEANPQQLSKNDREVLALIMRNMARHSEQLSERAAETPVTQQ